MLLRTMNVRGFTRNEMFLVTAILVVVIAMLLPAINVSHEQARRERCENNLGTIAQAANKFVNRNGAYPVGTPACGAFSPGQISPGCVGPNWLVSLLDDLGLSDESQTAMTCLQAATRFELDCYQAPLPGGELGVGQRTPPGLNCPSAAPLAPTAMYSANGFSQGIAKGSYVGCYGSGSPGSGDLQDRGVFDHVIIRDGSTGVELLPLDLGSSPASIRDGLSKTILASEVNRGDAYNDVRGAWFTTVFGGASFTTDGTPNADQLPGHAAGNHPGGVNYVTCEGGVNFAVNSIDPLVWYELGTKASVEVPAN